MVLDLLMPGVSGWDVLDFMEERPRLATVPVLILTAFEEGPEAPADRPVIHKPIDADLLRVLVDELLRQGHTAHMPPDDGPGDLLPRAQRRRGPPPWLA